MNTIEIQQLQEELRVHFAGRLSKIWVQRAMVGPKSNFCLTLFGTNFGASSYKIVVLNDVRNASLDYLKGVVEAELPAKLEDSPREGLLGLGEVRI
jgi:hypothetical protein